MVWITHHPHSLSFRDLYQKTAGIWAIIGTDRPFDLSWHENLPIVESIFYLDSDFNLILNNSVMVGWPLLNHQHRSSPPRQKGSRGNSSPKGGRGDFSLPARSPALAGRRQVVLQMGRRVKPPLPIPLITRIVNKLQNQERSVESFLQICVIREREVFLQSSQNSLLTFIRRIK